jgi:hypothetical protein
MQEVPQLRIGPTREKQQDNLHIAVTQNSTIRVDGAVICYRALRISPQAIFLPAFPAGWEWKSSGLL